jgi:hypothetical protein
MPIPWVMDTSQWEDNHRPIVGRQEQCLEQTRLGPIAVKTCSEHIESYTKRIQLKGFFLRAVYLIF